MSRLTLLSLQLLVAVVCIVLWQLFSTVPVFGHILLPPFFFSNPVDVGSQIIKWFSSGVIWKHLIITLWESILAFVIGSAGSDPTIAVSSVAASATVRVIGPAVSWLCAMGMIPVLLTRPRDGLIPTRPHALLGDTIDPSVSVPSATAA